MYKLEFEESTDKQSIKPYKLEMKIHFEDELFSSYAEEYLSENEIVISALKYHPLYNNFGFRLIGAQINTLKYFVSLETSKARFDYRKGKKMVSSPNDSTVTIKEDTLFTQKTYELPIKTNHLYRLEKETIFLFERRQSREKFRRDLEKKIHLFLNKIQIEFKKIS